MHIPGFFLGGGCHVLGSLLTNVAFVYIFFAFLSLAVLNITEVCVWVCVFFFFLSNKNEIESETII